jgi:hypothetical protein
MVDELAIQESPPKRKKEQSLKQKTVSGFLWLF